ncbi:MAG: glycogen synthase [Deltaproteobacteria bacterium]|nr:glycogen synthase [Deltaproteobacteria bacterium]
MHVCFVSSEAVPFAKVGGLADVASALPAALRGLGHRVTLVLPFYRGTDPTARSLARRLAPMRVACGPHSFPVEVFEGRLGTGVDVVLLRVPTLFEREGIYTSDPDEALRFAVLCRGALEVLAEREAPVDVVHAHDWPAALVPYYLARGMRERPALAKARALFTVHNVAHQPLLGPEKMAELGIDPADFHPDGVEFWGKVNLLKVGMKYADRVSTVSPTYAAEIATATGGCGLDGVVRSLARPVAGILNGIDPHAWNPAGDPHLPHAFGPDSLEGKFGCKMALQRRVGLPIRPNTTLAVAVARLVPQKGLDLVAAAAPRLLSGDVQLLVVGDGAPPIVEAFERLAREEPERVKLVDGFDEERAHLAYAGGDLFLLPSRYEPCGLTQLIAMRYGTVPVARRTGGLADTVIDLDNRLETGTGFVFDEADSAALFGAFQRALSARADRAAWMSLLERLMRLDHSWERSARMYDELYRTMVA